MIASVRGVVEARLPDGLIVSVGGVGLRLYASQTTLAGCGSAGEAVHLQTYLYVREDTLALYGFAGPDERHMFETLMTVSGIGPRVALSVLSTLSTGVLREALAAGDLAKLTRVPGVGRKMAERLVVELRGKMGERSPLVAVAGSGGAPVDADVVEALVALGFGLPEAQDAVRALGPEAPGDLEGRIKAALQVVQRQR